jgi:N6-adenosine-specific RNA methylase IME4
MNRDGYKVILANPPWRYRDYAALGERPGQGRDAGRHYPTLTVAELGALPVAEAAADHAALFLWATWPLLGEALTVIDAWGFHYLTLAWVWIKLNKKNAGLFIGNGRYTRANSEPCLLAVRGNLPVAAQDVLSVIMAPVREHSRKPEEQYAKIERLYPYGAYLELFAHHQRPAGMCWAMRGRLPSPLAVTAVARPSWRTL